MTDQIPVKAVKSGGAAVALGEYEVGDQIPAQYLAGLVGSNMLINCGVPINQRGFAGGALAAGVYGYDRWKAGAGGCNITINATTGVFTHTSGPLVQVVESPEAAWGAPVTLSVESPSGTISVSIGGASGSITAGSGRRSVTVTPSGSGNMTVELTATGVTYSQPRLERGGVATLPDYRQPAVELLLCQRYYEKSYSAGVAPGAATDQGQSAFFLYGLPNTNYAGGTTSHFKVTKRATPAITLYSPQTGAAGQIYNAGTSADVAGSAVGIGQNGFFANSGSFGPTITINLRWHWTADAEL